MKQQKNNLLLIALFLLMPLIMNAQASLEVIIGEGTSTNSNTQYPAPYGNWYWGAKHQILVLADEIYQAGGAPGTLTSLAFNVATLNSTAALTNFEIKLKQTTATELNNTWDADEFESVYISASYVNTLGWNTHEFTNPYLWDGVSNIIVDICFNNGSYTQNQSTYYTTTTYNSVRYGRNDAATVCTSPPGVTLSMNRPNMMFNLEVSGFPAPENLSPLNESFNVPLAALFDFSDVDGAVSYGIIVATDRAFTDIVINETDLPESQYQVPDEVTLLPLTIYYWKANATDGTETSSWSMRWKFTTEGELPPPVLVSPESGTTDLAPSTLLTWEEHYAATGYNLQVALDEAFEDIVMDVPGLTETSYITEGLAMSTQYYWRVQQFNDGSESEWCLPWTFTTGMIVIVGIGTDYDTDYYNYVSPSPYSNWYNHARLYFLYTAEELLAAGAIPNTYISNFGWNVAMMQGGVGPLNPGEYSIRMKLTTWTQLNGTWDYEDWSTVWEPEQVAFTAALGWNMHECFDPFYWDGTSSILVETCFSHYERIGNANPQQYWTTTPVARCQQRSVYEPNGPETYYCEIEDNIGWGGPKMNRANIKFIFTDNVILSPELVAPANNQFSVSVTPLFDWNESINATSYSLQIATDRYFSNIVYEANELSETELQLSEENSLAELAIYFWRVQAFGEELSSNWSRPFRFITQGPLPVPILLSPADASTGLFTNTNLSWEPHYAATGYNVQVAEDEGFEIIVNDVTGLEDNFYVTQGLELGGLYFWRVQMTNPTDISEWSTPWSFTTSENSIVIGTGTDYDTDYYNYVSPSPYSNWYNHARLYFLYTAAELLAAGAIPNTYITDFGWNVAALTGGVGPLNPGEYSIRMKLTTWTQLTNTWTYEDWTTVWDPETAFTAALGWNMHNCLEPFYWDGESSILVETCFSHWERIGNANPQQYWTTTPVARCQQRSVYEPSGPETDYCTIEENIGWGGGKMNRANIQFVFDMSGLRAPELVSPENGLLGVSTTPLLDWEPSEEAVSYSFQIATNQTFTELVLEINDIADTEYQIQPAQVLSESTLFYWRVNATNEEATSFWSRPWTFITDGPIPQVEKISPEEYSVSVNCMTEFVWEQGMGAFYYELEVATDNSFNDIVFSQSEIDGLSYQLDFGNMLENNSTYYWRVRGYRDENIGAWSTIWQFTTGTMVNIYTYSFFEEEEEYAEFSDGTPTNITNDDQLANFSLPFTFYYAGSEFNDLTISTNGWIALGTTTQNIWNSGLSFPEYPGFISPFWEDFALMPSNSNITVKVEGDAPYRAYAIQYKNVTASGQSAGNINFQLRFYETTNIITFNYGPMEEFPGTYWGAGIGMNGLYGGVMDFISVTPTFPAGISSIEPNNNILPDLFVNLPGRKFVFTPNTGTLLEPPVLVNPENGSIDVSVNPQLSWEAVVDADEYQIQVSANSNFTNIVVDDNSTSLSYNVTYDLEYLTQYWWRVKALNDDPNHSNWSTIWSFTTAEEIVLPENWLFYETDNFATIMVPSTINPMIGDRAMTEEDAIGLFYEITPGEWWCAGYIFWSPDGVSITVYGDDTETTIKDGFALGEPYTYRVWDGLALQEYPAYATNVFGPDAYEVSGFTMLASLTTTLTENQEITLNTGWNMVSSYIIPTYPSVETLFEDFESNLNIMKNSSGDMYIPLFNVNTIGNWDSESGYLVNMFENAVLTISGDKIVPESTPIPLNNGWNLPAYYRDNPMSPLSALASINSSLVLVKNNAGGIYSPIYGINTLGNMLPGQGYYFYLNQAALLTYPANDARKAIAGDDITPLAKHLIPQVNNTGNNATLLLSINVSNGNEVGVYNANNELIGSGAVNDGVAAVTIWGDNNITANTDGAKDNELLSVKLYNPNSSTLNEISLLNIQEITNSLEQDVLYYNSNAIYLAKATAQNEAAISMSIINIPNPVSSLTKFEFSLVNDDNAEIIIYNIRGEEIARLANGFYNAGTYSVSFDASNLISGAYNVVLRSGTQTASTIMMINK